MSGPPTGSVTFLFTDIEGSTKRWEHNPNVMKPALARHHAILRGAIEANGGYVFQVRGDAFCAAFSSAPQALEAALGAQRALYLEPWPAELGELRVRMALHPGVAEPQGGDYATPTLNRIARLLSAAHGGQVLLSEPAQDMVRDFLPQGVALLDMGQRRLKDLIRSERIFQLVAPDLPSDFPPLKTLDARPNNLPAQTTALIGRERELQAVCALLRNPQLRLVTLTGPGGTGKTRLGLQVAADMVDEFEHGVCFVSLAPTSDPGLVASAIAEALGVKEIADQPLSKILEEHLGEKEMLLLLDNFEQVAAAAPLVSSLLSAASRVKLLVTSRELLRLRGEHNFPVPPLEMPEPGSVLPIEQLTRYEAVRLFIERAEAVKADFQITNDNAPAVAEICHRLDGLPLAIELAAARIRIFSAEAMLARLDNRLKLLTGGARDLPTRQQTLRGTIEWSYELLEDADKALFRRLAVFVAGPTLEAAEAVCNARSDLQGDVLDGMESLVAKSLLQQRDEGGWEPRFWMLQTIREYALEKLTDSGEEGEIKEGHARYYEALAVRTEPLLLGPEQTTWLDHLETEHDNLRAALEWAHAAEAGAEIGLQLAGALGRFWQLRGYITEGRDRLAAALARDGATPGPDGVGDHALRAKSLGAAGKLAFMQSDYDAARANYEASLALWRDLDDKQGIAVALNGLGQSAYNQGDYDAARHLFERTLAIRRELRDTRGIAHTLNNLGIVAKGQGDYDRARTLLEEALARLRELGNKVDIAHPLNNLGNVLFAQGDYVGARKLFEESLMIDRELKNKEGIAYELGSIAKILLRQGDYGRAKDMINESLSLRVELGDIVGISKCLAASAEVARAQGKPELGTKLLGASEALLDTVGAQLNSADRMEYERYVEAARGSLSEGKFAAAWEHGRLMSMERAVAAALGDSRFD